MGYPKVVIIGGGFGGLNVALRLKNRKVDIQLVDKVNHHLFQPLLYQVATAALSPRDIAIPIREILKRQTNTTVMMNEVISINKHAQTITLANGTILPFDYLIVSVGTRHSYFGKERWEKHAPGLKTLPDALRIRTKILLTFEQAEMCNRVSDSEALLNFVVVGGGPTGVELAGAIAEIAHTTMVENFRKIDPSKTQIYLVEAAPHILPSYPEDLSRKAQTTLEHMGVRVLTNTKVVDITEDKVELDHGVIHSRNVLWAAGNQAPALLQTLDTPLDRQGRAIIEKDLTIPHHPNIFVIGDASRLDDDKCEALPGVAPVAIQQASYVAKVIGKHIPKDKRNPFRYFDKGSMATIGKAKAIVAMGKWHFSGLIAWLVWCFIHVVYLIDFRNRALVMLQWSWWYLTGQRSSRLIYNSVDQATQTMPTRAANDLVSPASAEPHRKNSSDVTPRDES